MDLKNGTITVGEMLRQPGVAYLLQRVSALSVNSPIVRAARNMTLNELMGKMRGRMSQEQMRQILDELKRL